MTQLPIQIHFIINHLFFFLFMKQNIHFKESLKILQHSGIIKFSSKKKGRVCAKSTYKVQFPAGP